TKVQVQGALRRDARLREEIRLLKQDAAAFARNSQERQIMNTLTAQKQLELSRSLGVTSAESARLQKAAGRSNKEMQRGFRGALAGTGLFRSLGRALAFASGGFLIFATAAQFVSGSITAAREWAKTQARLSAQFKANKQDLGSYRDEIERVATETSKLYGFTKNELVAGFVLAFRQTQKVGVGLRIMKDAVMMARATGRPYQQMVLGLTKAYGGMTTALRRAGILVPAGAKGMEVLAYAEKRFAGQALAGTTAAERFHAQLYNMEEAAGRVLLPTVEHLIGRLADWMGNTKNQIGVQRQFKEILSGVGGVVKVLAKIVETVTGALGGWANAIPMIVGGWLALKVVGVATATALKVANIAASVASVAAWRSGATAIEGANVAAAAATAAAWKAALISTGIGAIAVAAGVAAGWIATHWSKVTSIFNSTDQALQGIIDDFKQLETLSAGAAGVVTSKQQLAQAVVSKDEAREALRAAAAQERATRGTSGHKKALDQLRLAQANLAAANLQLGKQMIATNQVEVAQRNRMQDLIDKIAGASAHMQMLKRLQRTGGRGAQLGVLAIDEKAGRNVRNYIQNMEQLAQGYAKTNPRLYAAVRGLIAIADATHKIPDRKTIKVVIEAALHGSKKALAFFKVDPNTGLLYIPPPWETGAGGKPPPTTTGKSPITDFAKWLDKSFGLAKAKASVTKTQADDLRVARAEQKAILKLIRENRLPRDQLKAAYEALAEVNDQLAKDVKEAASFGERFDKAWGLAIAKASVTISKADDLAVAKKARA
ncbi:MAG TPA: hypothetical protein VF731_10235, partial [Solirubrobacterales bacterium]